MDLLDLVLHYDCNLACTYCTITEAMRRRPALGLREAAPWIDQAAQAGCTALSITGGEPTITGQLLPIVRYAARRGFTDVKVQSNGLLLAGRANLDRLLAAGCTHVELSVHGYDGDGAAYDAITRGEPGAHKLLLAALGHLVAADVRLSVAMIVMTETVATLPDAVRALAALGIRQVDLWFVSLTDNNRENVASMPRLTDVLPQVRACLDAGAAAGVTMRSLHVPRCLLPEHADRVAHPGVGQDVQVVTPDAAFQLSASRLSGGVKPERCATCRHDPVCSGLRQDYVDRFGDSELRPVE